MPRVILSVHFPKAAGSSLLAAFEKHFSNTLFRDYQTDPLDPLHFRNIAPNLYNKFSSTIPDNVSAVHGHFHINKYIDVNDAYRMTFLREPVDNLISIYYFWRLITGDAHGVFQLFKKTEPTIFEFAEFTGVKRLMSQTYFGDVDMSRFDFIGFYDRRAADLAILSNELGIQIDSEHHANKTGDAEQKSRDAILSDRAAVERLRSSLEDDCKFYSNIRNKWT